MDRHNTAPADIHAHHQAELRYSYWPFVGIVFAIFVVTVITAWPDHLNRESVMRYGMGYFFIVFGFFKMIRWKEFAHVFAEYDLIAKRWLPYGFIYPAVELILGALFLSQTALTAASIITVVIMTVGTIGVLQAIRGPRRYRCACLGAIIQLPLSTVSLTEDIGMGLMALGMLVSTLSS